jgi:hypothetical protein
VDAPLLVQIKGFQVWLMFMVVNFVANVNESEFLMQQFIGRHERSLARWPTETGSEVDVLMADAAFTVHVSERDASALRLQQTRVRVGADTCASVLS